MRSIQVTGARVHNLKNVSVTLPKGKMVVFTGPSGSGKSPLTPSLQRGSGATSKG